ncbi:hypothetical protein LMG28614_03694 [Paraburkholderia ultramafica]|uniref:Uncharacterized protein n=1 Tax=Paraburkholderia ultramafica TaxID=1544867 RepID=A0A6S7BB22_9BURK|nr:hypothetical protein LMG28614_03694 [Paraburkholderia ultramafica]
MSLVKTVMPLAHVLSRGDADESNAKLVWPMQFGRKWYADRKDALLWR